MSTSLRAFCQRAERVMDLAVECFKPFLRITD
jgi:hypothetical protein